MIDWSGTRTGYLCSDLKFFVAFSIDLISHLPLLRMFKTVVGWYSMTLKDRNIIPIHPRMTLTLPENMLIQAHFVPTLDCVSWLQDILPNIIPFLPFAIKIPSTGTTLFWNGNEMTLANLIFISSFCIMFYILDIEGRQGCLWPCPGFCWPVVGSTEIMEDLCPWMGQLGPCVFGMNHLSYIVLSNYNYISVTFLTEPFLAELELRIINIIIYHILHTSLWWYICVVCVRVCTHTENIMLMPL